DLAEGELVDDRAGQEAGVAHSLHLYLAEHLRDDDLDVLVVDIDALTPVNALHLADEIALDRIGAADAQDIVRHQGAVHQGVALPDVVAGVDAEMFAVRHGVLALFADRLAVFVHRLDHDGPLAAFLLTQADDAGDLGHNGRLARPACLEDF